MIDKPLISIIIPTFNRLFHLAELMESLTRQTFQDFEVIIVNDCGEKVNIIKTLYSDLYITILNMDRNLKHVHARNKGVKAANGEFIMLIDDDDLIVPTHIENMLNAIPEYDLVYSDVEIVNFKQTNYIRRPINRFVFAYDLDLKEMRKFSTFVPSGCLYRKELHNQIGLFDTNMYHYWDWDFFLRVSDKFKVNRVPIAGVLYDFSDSNSNQSKNLDRMKIYLDKLSTKHHLGNLPTKNFFVLLNEPEMRKRKAESMQIWDGNPFVSRLAFSSRND